jgi:hypothetical protein
LIMKRKRTKKYCCERFAQCAKVAYKCSDLKIKESILIGGGNRETCDR